MLQMCQIWQPAQKNAEYEELSETAIKPELKPRKKEECDFEKCRV